MIGDCKCCEVLKVQVEQQQKWIDRLMDEKVLDPTPQDTETIIPELEEPIDPLKESETFGQ